jgi:DNA adenine methylase
MVMHRRTATVVTAPAIPCFGGKTRVAGRISALLPAHGHYVEPFAGSLAVLLAKHPSRLETANDLDGDLMVFGRVLRERPGELARVCAVTPHSRAEHESSYTATGETLDDLEQARRTWVRLSQVAAPRYARRGGAITSIPPGSSISMPRYREAYVDRMAAAAQRLQQVSLECRPAIEVISAYGKFEAVCLYVDPPYLGQTRCRNYRTEMTGEDEHTQLWDCPVGRARRRAHQRLRQHPVRHRAGHLGSHRNPLCHTPRRYQRRAHRGLVVQPRGFCPDTVRRGGVP